MTQKILKARALSKLAFNNVKHRIPEAEASDVYDYIFNHGEWGLGIESLVAVFLQGGIQLTPEEKLAVCEAAEYMNLEVGQEKIEIL